VPDFATPYVIREVTGVQVGLIGLTTVSTRYTTFPTYLSDYEFVPYANALTQWVPQVWDAGADVILVVGHICYDEMVALAPVARDLGVSMMGGGHCHQLVAETQQGVALIQAGWRFAHYAKLEVEFNLDDADVIGLSPSYAANQGGTADVAVAAVVAQWDDAAAVELSATVGYAEQVIDRYSPAMHNLVTDSWLYAYPTADIVMTNSGGIRQSIPAGDVTRGTIVGVLPFQNNLVALQLTGDQVIGCVGGDLILGGMTAVGGYFHANGTPIVADSVYSVLTTDYLHARNDYCFQALDDNPYPTGLGYHQPTIDYIESLATSPAQPLDDYLDHTARR
jgi:2',3'-cyclic-nucleotide 2'-phosphodiesterase (5'-nucleotidase family)